MLSEASIEGKADRRKFVRCREEFAQRRSHGAELQYVFRTSPPYEPSALSPMQDALARRMQGFWGRLAAGTLGEEEWPPCTTPAAACDAVMVFDTPETSIVTARCISPDVQNTTMSPPANTSP